MRALGGCLDILYRDVATHHQQKPKFATVAAITLADVPYRFSGAAEEFLEATAESKFGPSENLNARPEPRPGGSSTLFAIKPEPMDCIACFMIIAATSPMCRITGVSHYASAAYPLRTV
ncbi:hypothetical protein HPB50_005948 [Hyalomma asiaticum]|uniref:Uncharacterized protein n=1 Tax=Hyalomma asiaticum TaxID=266040 RepID=A0ACB7RTB0_HYAAI|nr:hypothetical protein HPB50_005948 [Hyalomma asiaticum]